MDSIQVLDDLVKYQKKEIESLKQENSKLKEQNAKVPQQGHIYDALRYQMYPIYLKIPTSYYSPVGVHYSIELLSPAVTWC